MFSFQEICKYKFSPGWLQKFEIRENLAYSYVSSAEKMDAQEFESIYPLWLKSYRFVFTSLVNGSFAWLKYVKIPSFRDIFFVQHFVNNSFFAHFVSMLCDTSLHARTLSAYLTCFRIFGGHLTGKSSTCRVTPLIFVKEQIFKINMSNIFRGVTSFACNKLSKNHFL